MGDKSENQTLLSKQIRKENQPYCGDGGSSSGDDSLRSDEWWDHSDSETGSSCSSCCTDSRSDNGSAAEWEAEISPDGDLFFIRSPPPSELLRYTQPPVEEVLTKVPNNGSEGHSHRKGKLVGFIRRRNSKRYRHKTSNAVEAATSKMLQMNFQPSSGGHNTLGSYSDQRQIQDEEIFYDVNLHITPGNRHNLGRRATLVESLIGLVVDGSSEGSQVKIVGFIPHGEAIRHHGIQIGDCLFSIDGREVNIHNVDSVLETFATPTKIALKFKRTLNSSGNLSNSAENKQASEICEQSNRVQQLLNYELNTELLERICTAGVGVLYLSQEALTAGEEVCVRDDDQSLLYCFPPHIECCPLAPVRGAFLTLHLLLPELAPSSPTSSTLMIGGQMVHVLYIPEVHELLLVGIPGNRYSLQEARELVSDVVKYLQFNYQTLSRAFTKPELRESVNKFFTQFFSYILLGENTGPKFEDLMLAAHWIPLPQHAQVRLNSALSELEANDFEELAGNINDCQRLYTIIGSCMYHKGYLLASHMPHLDIPDVHTCLRQLGLLELTRMEPLRRLILWREVYLASCGRGLASVSSGVSANMSVSSSLEVPCSVPLGQWFLLVVGQEWDMLAVLLESGGCTVRLTNNPGPDICFVEEAIDTLSYIQSIGISAIAKKWITGQSQPQVINPEMVNISKNARSQDNFLAFMRNSEAKLSMGSTSVLSVNSSGGCQRADSASSVKRRSPDRLHSGLSAGSEDSASQACSSSMLSECSDETVGGGMGAGVHVVGRRAERELRTGTDSRLSGGLRSDHSDSDDSDWETYQAYSHRGYAGSSSETSDAALSILADVEEILPVKLNAGGDNIMFHYIQLDAAEGILLAPSSIREKAPGSSQLQELLAVFRKSCHSIHDLLQNTVSFKKSIGQEVTKTMNRSLVAIKEHGLLFELSSQADADTNKKNSPSLSFWVVGRLFFTPQPREIYVCYLDTIPQNMVEIAFRLGLSITG